MGRHGHPGAAGSDRIRNNKTRSGFSSSDDEIRSTPECTSCGEEEMESESVSEKGRKKKKLRDSFVSARFRAARLSHFCEIAATVV